jgi:hypothetical protein
MTLVRKEGEKKRQDAAICYDEKNQRRIESRRRTCLAHLDYCSGKRQVSTAFAQLSKPQVCGLVLWSAGIALAGTAGIRQISALLALVLQQQEQAVFQRLRAWYLDAQQKSGTKRRELEVTSCFASLL